jgi:hypothetical protein
MRLRHRLVGVLGAIFIAFVLAAPVAADTTGGGNGTQATALEGVQCSNNGDGTFTCSQAELDAFKGKVSGDFVCYDEFMSTFNPATDEHVSSRDLFGCTENSGNVSVNKLESVVVASTEIALTAVDCDADGDCTESDGGTISIAATWTGIGPTLKSSSNSHFRDGSCVTVDKSKSTSRGALFEGPLAGPTASISVGTSSLRVRCK